MGIPVLVSVVLSLVQLLAVRYPDLGWATTVNADAKAVFLGIPLYEDPAAGYTGLFYTPLFPGLVGVLDRIWFWDGWPILVSGISGLVTAGVIGRITFGPVWVGQAGRERVRRGLGLVGMAGVAWWLVSAVSLNLLLEARADQLAWSLAICGAILAVGSQRLTLARAAFATVLLVAAFWTKQSTLPVVGAALIMLLMQAWIVPSDRRRALAIVGSVVVSNAALAVALNIWTSGWSTEFIFRLAGRHMRVNPLSWSLGQFWMGLGLLVVLVCLVWMPLALRSVWRAANGVVGNLPAWRPRLSDPDMRLRVLMALSAVVGLVAAVYFMGKQGSADNQFIGVAWALAALVGLGYRRLGEVFRQGVAVVTGAAATIVVVLSGLALAPLAAIGANAPPAIWRSIDWPTRSPELVAYARDHLIYDPVNSDLNTRPQGILYPNYFNIADLLAAGIQPGYLRDALLQRRFDAVALFDEGNEPYVSAWGQREENYLWKLNRVIHAGYMTTTGAPAGLLVRRPGPSKTDWMRDCWGPFTVGGVKWAIGRGGGFWCEARDGLALVATPAAASEVRTPGVVPADKMPKRIAVRATAGSPHLAIVAKGCSGQPKSGYLRASGMHGGLRWDLVFPDGSSGRGMVGDETPLILTWGRVGAADESTRVTRKMIMIRRSADCEYRMVFVAPYGSRTQLGN